MFSTAPAGGLIPLVPTRFTEIHASSPLSMMCRRAKDHLRTPGGGLPEPLRSARKTSPAAQRSGGHRRVATRKATGDLATRRGAGDPERRAEWTTVLTPAKWKTTSGLHRSWWTLVKRTEWEPPALCAAPPWEPPRCLPASPATFKRVRRSKPTVW